LEEVRKVWDCDPFMQRSLSGLARTLVSNIVPVRSLASMQHSNSLGRLASMASVGAVPSAVSSAVPVAAPSSISSRSTAKPIQSVANGWTGREAQRGVSVSAQGGARRRSSSLSAVSARRWTSFPTHVGLRQDASGAKNFAGKVQPLRRKIHATAPRAAQSNDGRISQAEFTDMAWQAVVSSLDVAKESKQQIVETEHLLKALLEQKNGLARRIFSKAGVDNTSLLQAAERYIQRQPKVTGSTSGSVLGRDLEALIERARGHKKIMGDSFVSVEHLVLSYVNDTRFGQNLFREFKLTDKTLKAAIEAIRGPQKVTDQGK
jgi:hypothetical protein